MPFQIIRNDITKVQADAIVNTANPWPVVGPGVDCAIHTAAGPELLSARKEIGRIPVGGSAATPAFQLPAKYVIHTVSPFWEGGDRQEEALLRKAYLSALELAKALGCRSAAFPLMAAGAYAFPKDLAISVAVSAFTDFLLEHEMSIYLVLFNAEAFGLAGSLFDGLKSYIDENYVSEKHREESMSAQFPQMVNAPRREDRKPLYEHFVPVGSASIRPDLIDEADAAAPAGDLEAFLRQHEKTFSEYLLDLLKERKGKDSEVYKRAEVSKQLFSKILNNKNYQPSKDTVIQLAIGLQLNLPQTQKLLEKAGYTLTRSSKADLVVQYCIERKIYSVTFINEALSDCGLPLLKTGLKY